MANAGKTPGQRLLDGIEWIGNKLPDPVFLFIGAAVVVMILSAIGSAMGWAVTPVRPTIVTETVAGPGGEPITRRVLDERGRPRVALRPEVDEEGKPRSLASRSLLSREGVYWAFTNMVRNFVNFAPLGLILVCMFGIGVAEKVGLFGALLKWLAMIVPGRLLTPTTVFLGIMSNIASDAGYLVLPPLAAALFVSAGRSPLAGIAAAFAGIAAGFSANLLVTAGDALVAGITQVGAQVLVPSYQVNPTCNWWFMAASTVILVLVGWATTAWIVEPRVSRLSAEEGGPVAASTAELRQQELSPGEKRALRWALIAFVLSLAAVLALILIPGAPLHGLVNPDNPRSPGRWTQAVVPIIFLCFLAPGLAYGMATGEIRSHRDVTKCFIHAMASMAPVITLYFFAAQFVEYLNYSNLGRMLAFIGGSALVEAGLSRAPVLAGLVLLTLTINLFIGSMSAKWTMLSPIFVPMLMMIGVSPELTQASYRVGDSVTNSVTPLNPYMIIILMAMQKYARDAKMGTLIALMAPYSAAFLVTWLLLLLGWIGMGVPLGPGGPLEYIPGD